MTLAKKPGLGINAGHGFVKLCLLQDNHAPQTYIMPSLVAPAEKQLAGALQRVPTVQVDGKDWWVGEDALISQSPRTALDQARIKDPVVIPALVKRGLQCLVGENGTAEATDAAIRTAYTVSALPATWSTSRELAEALGARLRAVPWLSETKKRIVAEPLGLIYAMTLDNDGTIVGDGRFQTGRVAVIDAGHLTIDVAVMQRLVPEPESLQTIPLGTARALQGIAKHLSAAFDVDIPLHKIDGLVRTGELRLGGQVMELPNHWDVPLVRNAEDVAARLGQLWGSGRQFDGIIIGGGGEAVQPLVDALTKKFPHATLSGHGQLGIALGLARLARALGQRL